MEKQWLNGKELVKRWNVHDIEIFDYVKKGLQPYGDDRRPMSPPGVESLESEINSLKREKQDLENQYNCFTGKPVTVDEWGKILNWEVDGVRDLDTIFYSDGSTQGNRDYYASINTVLQEAEENLEKYPSRPSWRDVDLYKAIISPGAIIKLLLDAFYKLKHVLEFEKRYEHTKLKESADDQAVGFSVKTSLTNTKRAIVYAEAAKLRLADREMDKVKAKKQIDVILKNTLINNKQYKPYSRTQFNRIISKLNFPPATRGRKPSRKKK